RFGHTNDAVFSVKQDRSRYSDWSAALVDHRTEGEGNSVAKLSYHWFRPQRSYNRDFSFEFYKSLTRGPGGEGSIYSFSADNWGARDELGWHVRLNQIDPDFQ